jgi:hypothetical protein
MKMRGRAVAVDAPLGFWAWYWSNFESFGQPLITIGQLRMPVRQSCINRAAGPFPVLGQAVVGSALCGLNCRRRAIRASGSLACPVPDQDCRAMGKMSVVLPEKIWLAQLGGNLRWS